MDDTSVGELLRTLIQQGAEQTELLRSIDNRLVELIQGVATVVDATMG